MLLAGTPLQGFPEPFPSASHRAMLGGERCAALVRAANHKGRPSLAGPPLFQNNPPDCFSIHPLRSALRMGFRSLRAATRGYSPLDSREPFSKRLKRKLLNIDMKTTFSFTTEPASAGSHERGFCPRGQAGERSCPRNPIGCKNRLSLNAGLCLQARVYNAKRTRSASLLSYPTLRRPPQAGSHEHRALPKSASRQVKTNTTRTLSSFSTLGDRVSGLP